MLDERGAKENLRTRFPTGRKPYATRYDYEDDSDLEEDDDDDIVDDEPASPPQVVTKKPRDDSDIIVLENSDAKSNEPSDILSVSDLDSLFSESPDTKGGAETTSSAHIGKVVVIEDVAFVTWVRFRIFLMRALRLLVTGSRRCSDTCTPMRLSSRHGAP